MGLLARYAEGVRMGDQNAMYQSIKVIDQHMDFVGSKIGGATVTFVDGPGAAAETAVAPPPAATFNVTGVDGKFITSITNPQDVQAMSVFLQTQQTAQGDNSNNAPILHNLQSAFDTNFDNNSNLKDYGTSSQLHWADQDPNVTRFFRLRSSFDGQAFNDWQLFSSALVCGPIGVKSGLLRNSANSINQAATTPTGANPLTQHGTSTQIDVSASVWKCGDQTINYNGGSVDPGSFGTWLVYANDTNRAGGTVTFVAVNTANQAAITGDNGNVYFGKITTAGGGGGGGSGGGGGTCCRTGVPYRAFDGSSIDAANIRVGHELIGVDSEKEIVQSVVVHAARPCFRLEFNDSGKLVKKEYIGDFTVYQIELDRSHTFIVGSNFVIDGAASTHTIQRMGGGFIDVFSAVVGESFNLIGDGVGSHNNLKA